MRRCAVITMLLLCVPFPLNILHAQDSSKVSVRLYGFVRNYFNFDSRQTYTVVGGEYNMIPYDEKWNENHSEDLNAAPHAQLQALTSRFGINVSGPVVLGWASDGKIEGDFGGFGSNNSVLRLRLAYVRLSKGATELLCGQAWHPLSGDIMPDVLGMAAGAPFRPHSRTPQLRATRYWGSFGVTVSLLYQLQYMNNGPASPSNPASVASVDFAHNALWPEAFVGVSLRRDGFFGQMGVDAQIIRPRTHALIGAVTKSVDETVESLTPTLYAQYEHNKLSIKFRTLLAQNTSHLNQLVGYGVAGVNADGSWRYVPLRSTISYLNAAYGRKYRFNLFVGYMKNLGAGEDLWDYSGAGDYHIYMKGGGEFVRLNSVYRIAPSISYNVKSFNLGLEYEWTAATYGDLATDGSIVNNGNLHQVANHRLCALVKYNF